jgi:hypothetical protein
MSTDTAGQTVITPEAVASFPTLFEAKPDLNGEDKFSVTLVFPKGTDVKPLMQALLAAGKKKFGDKAADIIRNQKDPAIRGKRPQDVEKAKKYGYPEGSLFVTTKSKTRPGVVSTFRGPDGKPQLITDPAQIYSGCIVKAQIYAHAYDSAGNKGVTFFLNNVQKIRDGERLDGRIDARDAFEATDEPVDLSEMELASVGATADAGDDLDGLLG